MNQRVDVYHHRSHRGMEGCGYFLGICIVLGAIIAFFAWPFYVHIWPLGVRWAVEVAWLGVLAGLVLLGRRGAQGRHAGGGGVPVKESGPRDWEPPAHEPLPWDDAGNMI